MDTMTTYVSIRSLLNSSNNVLNLAHRSHMKVLRQSPLLWARAHVDTQTPLHRSHMKVLLQSSLLWARGHPDSLSLAS